MHTGTGGGDADGAGERARTPARGHTLASQGEQVSILVSVASALTLAKREKREGQGQVWGQRRVREGRVGGRAGEHAQKSKGTGGVKEDKGVRKTRRGEERRRGKGERTVCPFAGPLAPELPTGTSPTLLLFHIFPPSLPVAFSLSPTPLPYPPPASIIPLPLPHPSPTPLLPCSLSPSLAPLFPAHVHQYLPSGR